MQNDKDERVASNEEIEKLRSIAFPLIFKKCWRIVTWCPLGMSVILKDYLEKPVSQDLLYKTTMRDVIANKLYEPFQYTKLPFCCTFLGWASSTIDSGLLNEMFNLIGGLTVSTSEDLVSLESFTKKIDGGEVGIGVAYPLLDCNDNERLAEYNSISIQKNDKNTNYLLAWAYEALLIGALSSDECGIVCVVSSDSESLAEAKIQEILDILHRE